MDNFPIHITRNKIPVPLPQEKHFHGFKYTQLLRGIRSCIYEQTVNGKIVGYEVFLIQILPLKLINDKEYPTRERWPRDEDFGRSAWAVISYKKAINKFNGLESICQKNR